MQCPQQTFTVNIPRLPNNINRMIEKKTTVVVCQLWTGKVVPT